MYFEFVPHYCHGYHTFGHKTESCRGVTSKKKHTVDNSQQKELRVNSSQAGVNPEINRNAQNVTITIVTVDSSATCASDMYGKEKRVDNHNKSSWDDDLEMEENGNK